jgi:predicted short-subunit dehydrogenase-like oxidoreductase (DUF2520 family)
MKRVIIIGSGNVADALVRAFLKEGNPPIQVFARNVTKAASVAAICGCPYTDNAHDLLPADLYIIAVADKAVKQVAAALPFNDGVVAHTAGSMGLDVFPPKVRNRAVFYPLQTFTKGRDVNMVEVPILIEADNPSALEIVREVACELSDNVREMDSEKRRQIHVAAVFSNNFTNYMYAVGEELAKKAGQDFSILKPLILETAIKALSVSSPRDVQTGPAIRNDFETRSRHVELLAQNPHLQNIYVNISKNIGETLKKI